MTSRGKSKAKKHFLITAGGTREYIDPVRFISNASSGRMGFALARAAIRAGHTVTLIAAPTTIKPPAQADIVSVTSAKDMGDAVKQYFADSDCLVMAAAVADYTPLSTSSVKIKKSKAQMSLQLKRTVDILGWAGAHKRNAQIVVGFALDDKHLLENAEKKLAGKNLDMIVANTPDAIDSEKVTIHVKPRNRNWICFENVSKTVAARRILACIEKQ